MDKIQEEHKLPEQLQNWKIQRLNLWKSIDPQRHCRLPTDVLWQKIVTWESIRNYRFLHILARVCKRWHQQIFGVVLSRQHLKLMIKNDLSRSNQLKRIVNSYVTEITSMFLSSASKIIFLTLCLSHTDITLENVSISDLDGDLLKSPIWKQTLEYSKQDIREILNDSGECAQETVNLDCLLIIFKRAGFADDKGTGQLVRSLLQSYISSCFAIWVYRASGSSAYTRSVTRT